MENFTYNLQPGGEYIEEEEGLHWNDPENPFNGSDDEEGGDFYESYEEGYYSEDEPDGDD